MACAKGASSSRGTRGGLFGWDSGAGQAAGHRVGRWRVPPGHLGLGVHPTAASHFRMRSRGWGGLVPVSKKGWQSGVRPRGALTLRASWPRSCGGPSSGGGEGRPRSGMPGGLAGLFLWHRLVCPALGTTQSPWTGLLAVSGRPKAHSPCAPLSTPLVPGCPEQVLQKTRAERGPLGPGTPLAGDSEVLSALSLAQGQVHRRCSYILPRCRGRGAERGHDLLGDPRSGSDPTQGLSGGLGGWAPLPLPGPTPPWG